METSKDVRCHLELPRDVWGHGDVWRRSVPSGAAQSRLETWRRLKTFGVIWSCPETSGDMETSKDVRCHLELPRDVWRHGDVWRRVVPSGAAQSRLETCGKQHSYGLLHIAVSDL
ncbi:hypothetical protein ElyMa_006878700 [Elysia marginata]|uniref:Uncharacterized protein n=1 Tax=Elysia marginata TaxID=1093978 RepID=A0AAV4JA35_9GAST|nr:hypothetical protein ElyMa_006878700 [Elysia marginata]